MALPSAQTRSGAGPSDAALVVAARANERWAQEALFRRHAAMVNGLAFRLVGRDADLDDLVQDCFAEAWRSLGRLSEPAAFSSWLGAIVVRTAHKLIRRRRLLARLGFRDAGAIEVDQLISPAAPADLRAELRAVYTVVESLPAATRVAFVLRRVEGLALEEIVTLTGASLATVKRRIAEGERRILAATGRAEDPS
jgi:RNA polymerase sigma-70 factor (ECF subfamily)